MKPINEMTLSELRKEENSLGACLWECEQAGQFYPELKEEYHRINDMISELEERK